jgi:hypothetical protein
MITELRFLKGNWPFGKFKLQARYSNYMTNDWHDVAIADFNADTDESQNLFDTKFVQSPEKYSITDKFKKPNKITEKSIKWFCEGCAHYHLIADTVDFKYCSYCGRKRHEQRTKRDILAQKMFDYHIRCKTDAGYEMQALADIAIEFLLGTEE